ncbi:MerR family transcriptional regulator [Polycladomyces sp. WAk]|uniref:MerR family transcriptional regulator n=2 Tax=Polycladomyces zharkentensis TaxID=2807616 RepID=A0ABS2WL43_9BACL|nr:MerR family transcriptional regulator [Polycladomyces sp. WAk]MBN2910254.1 MerR family transcriptional regulator [Polycladomyces sp. WAk]
MRSSAGISEGPWTIKDVAERVGLSAHTIRYYEQEGLLPSLKRDQHGNRIFEERDIEWLELVICLRETGMPIAEIRRYVDLGMEGDQTIPMRKQILQKHRQMLEKKMEEINKALTKIDKKMKWYDSKK